MNSFFPFSFWFRAENELSFSAPVSFSAINVKSIFGRSLPDSSDSDATLLYVPEQEDTVVEPDRCW